ncbi:MAG TPA: SLC13 family permease [Longimicrobiales bacterium]|nr:SLC13 family permease [Longimicrobiales bacterium]
MSAGMFGLSWHAWATIAVVTGMVVLLVRDSIAPAMAVFGANVALLIIGVIDVPSAFAGFANPAPMTVAALFVVARAVEKTGALQPLINATLGNGGSSRNMLGRLLVPTAGASAFLNNTPIVAMLTPQVTNWAARRGISPSRFLMPISFATILGGTITVIGTSTNLVVSGLLEQSGYAPIGMFEITRIGLPVAIVGIIFLVLFSHMLLPERRTARRHFQEEFREFVVQMAVLPHGPLDGVTVEEGSLRHLEGVFLAEVRRRDEVIAPARPDTVLLGGDQLTFVGRVDVVRDLQAMRGLVGAERPHTTGMDDETHTFFEVVVSGASSLAGKTLREADFRNRFQAAVVAIHRAGARVNEKLGAVTLREGDTLLLLSDRGFANRWRDGNEFLLVSHLGGSPPVSTRKAITVGVITAAIVGVAGAGLLPMVHTALLGALLIVALRVLTPAEARAALDLDVLVVIAASFGIGAAIEQSGLAAVLADVLVGGLATWGPLVLLTAVVLATVTLTELITNNAAAVLIYPIAIAIALDSGLDPRPFAIAITVAASASFLTPIGYQTNTMVYGLGGYRFTDYARLGLPLTVAVVTAVIFFVPMFWPF